MMQGQDVPCSEGWQWYWHWRWLGTSVRIGVAEVIQTRASTHLKDSVCNYFHQDYYRKCDKKGKNKLKMHHFHVILLMYC